MLQHEKKNWKSNKVKNLANKSATEIPLHDEMMLNIHHAHASLE